jgi:uridine kinase
VSAAFGGKERLVQAVAAVVDVALTRRASHSPAAALLVGLSGIDGSGKGYLADYLVRALTAYGLKTALLNVDGWLNLPSVRFDPVSPGEHFYEHALRLEELFARLILPLRDQRQARVTMEWVEETATASRPYTYEFVDLDIIALEGVYLFKRAYRKHFDLAVWVDCSWQTALERSVARAQEGLSPEETRRAYRTIFFPAEEIHFERDDPRGSADLIVANDPHLLQRGPAGAQRRQSGRTRHSAGPGPLH